MSRRGSSKKNRKRNWNKRGDDKEGLDQEAVNTALEIDTASSTRAPKCKKMNSVIDSEGLTDMTLDGRSTQRGTSRVLRKRSIDQVIPSTSGSMRTRLKRGSAKADRGDITIIRYTEYNEEKEAQSAKQAILSFPTAKDADVYNMNFKKRGLCVIFNQQEFEKGTGKFRKGSEIDVKSIQRTFGNLGFTVEEHANLTFGEVMKVISNLSKLDYSESDCLCIFVLTHGSKSGIVYAKDAAYPLLNIWTPFSTDNCSSLAGKPKLLFIQACRGGDLDEGVEGKSAIDNSGDTYTLPTNADFLFGYSTIEGYCSWRMEERGSWYIQSLCNVIDEHWKNTDLLKMLTLTARKVAQDFTSVHLRKELNDKKQMPSLTSTLTRDLYFTPKIEYQ